MLVTRRLAWATSLLAGYIIHWLEPDLTKDLASFSLPCKSKDSYSKEEDYSSKSVANQSNA